MLKKKKKINSLVHNKKISSAQKKNPTPLPEVMSSEYGDISSGDNGVESHVTHSTFVIPTILIGIVAVVSMILGTYAAVDKLSSTGGTVSGFLEYDGETVIPQTAGSTIIPDINWVRVHHEGPVAAAQAAADAAAASATNAQTTADSSHTRHDERDSKFDATFGALLVGAQNGAPDRFLIYGGGASVAPYISGTDFNPGSPGPDYPEGAPIDNNSGFYSARWSAPKRGNSEITGFSWSFPLGRTATNQDFRAVFAIEVGQSRQFASYPDPTIVGDPDPTYVMSGTSIVVKTGANVAENWYGTVVFTEPIPLSPGTSVAVRWLGAVYTLGGTTTTVHMRTTA